MREVVGAASGPREGWITVVCSDGSVWIGLEIANDDWPLNPEQGKWRQATPIPGTAAAEIRRGE